MVHLPDMQRTCKDELTIAVYKSETIENCTAACDALERCRFLYFNILTACRLYSNCDETRKPPVKGSTLKKNMGNILGYLTKFSD